MIKLYCKVVQIKDFQPQSCSSKYLKGNIEKSLVIDAYFCFATISVHPSTDVIKKGSLYQTAVSSKRRLRFARVMLRWNGYYMQGQNRIYIIRSNRKLKIQDGVPQTLQSEGLKMVCVTLREFTVTCMLVVITAWLKITLLPRWTAVRNTRQSSYTHTRMLLAHTIYIYLNFSERATELALVATASL